MSSTRNTLVVLEVLDDQADRSWEEALGLPPFHRWFERLPQNVHAKIIHERHEVYDHPPPPPA